MFNYENANEAQKEAISATDGLVLITAGPGTGKTFTLVKRAVYLIQECGIQPEQIMMATFTEKAAKELITRITNELAERNVSVNVNEMYIDVLREIGNIGAGNATTSLASMINEQIDMNVPKVELMEASKLSSAICPEDEIIVGIFLEVTHDITGSMMFLMRMDSAHYLVNKLMGRDPENDAPFDEMDLSAMKEIGNIITASYLSALSSMTNLTILPSVPYIAVDMAGAILSVPAIQFGQYGNNALLIETEFGDERMINGYFILMPEEESYAKILSSLGIQL
mgnify:CR=1 FL=1